MFKLALYLNPLALCFAVVCGIIARRYLPQHWRLVVFHLSFALLVELWALALSIQHRTNIPVYNVYIIEEVLVLGGFGIVQLQQGVQRILAAAGLLVAIAVNVVCFINQPMQNFHSIAFLVNCVYLTALFLGLILMLQIKGETGLFRQPVLYLSVGIVLYFGCDIPYFSLRSWFLTHDPALNTILYLSINTGLATVRYILAGLALLLFYKNGRKLSTIA